MKPFIKKLHFIILLLIFIAACTDNIVTNVPSVDETNSTTQITSTFSGIQKNIFNQSCALSGCHAGAVSPNLSEGKSYNNIVNKLSSKGIPYIKPNEPDNSYILQKVLGSNTISGSRMPLNSSPLNQTQINAIIEWINAGAKNN